MAGQASLENTIEGLAGAVVEAQRRIASHQIKNILSCFDKINRTKGIDIRLPSLYPLSFQHSRRRLVSQAHRRRDDPHTHRCRHFVPAGAQSQQRGG